MRQDLEFRWADVSSTRAFYSVWHADCSHHWTSPLRPKPASLPTSLWGAGWWGLSMVVSGRNRSCRRGAFFTFSSTLGLSPGESTSAVPILPVPIASASQPFLWGSPWRLRVHPPAPGLTCPVASPHSSQSDHVTAQHVHSEVSIVLGWHTLLRLTRPYFCSSVSFLTILPSHSPGQSLELISIPRTNVSGSFSPPSLVWRLLLSPVSTQTHRTHKDCLPLFHPASSSEVSPLPLACSHITLQVPSWDTKHCVIMPGGTTRSHASVLPGTSSYPLAGLPCACSILSTGWRNHWLIFTSEEPENAEAN